MTDEQLSSILQALMDSHSESVTTLTISNQTIGSQCIEIFKDMLPLLYSFTFNNIKFDLPKRVPKCLLEKQSSQTRMIILEKNSDGNLSLNEGTKSVESLEDKKVVNIQD